MAATGASFEIYIASAFASSRCDTKIGKKSANIPWSCLLILSTVNIDKIGSRIRKYEASRCRDSAGLRGRLHFSRILPKSPQPSVTNRKLPFVRLYSTTDLSWTVRCKLQVLGQTKEHFRRWNVWKIAAQRKRTLDWHLTRLHSCVKLLLMVGLLLSFESLVRTRFWERINRIRNEAEEKFTWY
jgi:hypothetical protein